jgi:type I restriction enzyme S subunit
MVPLGEVVDFYSGGTPSKSDASFWDGEVPWFSAKDMKANRLFDSTDHLAPDVFARTSLRRVPAGTVVMVVRGMILAHTVPISILEIDAAINQDIKALIPRTELDAAYLAAMLRAQHSTILAKVGTAAHGTKKLDSRVLAEIEIPLPNLQEQRRIASIFDHVDAIRRRRCQVLGRLDELTRSVFQATSRQHGGEVRALGDVAAFIGGASLPIGEPFAEQRLGTLLMRVSDMNAPGNEERIGSAAFWTAGRTARSATTDAGAVVLPKRGASIATNKKRITTRRTALDPNLMGVQPDVTSLTSRYLYEWFKSFDLVSITTGTTVPQLNKQDLAPLLIQIPSLAVQHELDSRLSLVGSHHVRAERALGATDALMRSLLYRALRGEV